MKKAKVKRGSQSVFKYAQLPALYFELVKGLETLGELL